MAQFMPDLVFKQKPGKSNEAADELSQASVLNEVTLDGKVLQNI